MVMPSVTHLPGCLASRASGAKWNLPVADTHAAVSPQEPEWRCWSKGPDDKDVFRPCLWQLRQIRARQWCCSVKAGGISDKASSLLHGPHAEWPELLSHHIPPETHTHTRIIRGQGSCFIFKVSPFQTASTFWASEIRSRPKCKFVFHGRLLGLFLDTGRLHFCCKAEQKKLLLIPFYHILGFRTDTV